MGVGNREKRVISPRIVTLIMHRLKVSRAELNSKVSYKVLIKAKGGSGFSSDSPLKLPEELKRELGDVINATNTKYCW